MPEFLERQRTLDSYWRAIILFGKNVASYKFALAQSLIELSSGGKSFIALEELAVPFSRCIVDHLQSAPKQATSRSSRFLEACRKSSVGEIGKDELIRETVRLGFDDVIDHFHIVNRADIPVRFFQDERSGGKGGLQLTDELFRLREHIQFGNLPQEVDARWRLVETAWQLNLPAHLVMGLDDSGETLTTNHTGRRVAVTRSRDALNGYQKGKCFYCFSDISIDTATPVLADVDHFFPRVLLRFGIKSPLDGVWNLVLSCQDCNRGTRGKSSLLPEKRLLERISTRNEFLIRSHHPLRETLIAQTGASEKERNRFLTKLHDAAGDRLIHTWGPKFENEAAF